MTLLDVKLLTMPQNENLDYIHTLLSEKIKLLTSFLVCLFHFNFKFPTQHLLVLQLLPPLKNHEVIFK